MTHRSPAAASLLLALLACACAGRPIPPTPADPRAFGSEAWRSPIERDHRLVGYALSVADERWVEAREIADALARAEFIFLGETHDNEDHHRLQALLLRAALAEGRRPALALEMLDTSQEGALAEALQAATPTADGIAEAVQWKKSGWPDFAIYRPIVEVALEAKLGLVAANLPRPIAREAVRKGLEPLPEEVRTWMQRAGEPSEGELATWAREMEENHCGEVPKELLVGLVRAQRARDVQMALRVAAAGAASGAVLVTGDGHARADRGVPRWLDRIVPGRRAVSVGIVEVDGDWPRQYAAAYGTARFPFDYVIFTPRAEREDPCEGMKRRSREAREKQAK